MVSLETLETQPLLDNADTSLDFVTRKDNVPVSIERLNGEFLLHYTDYSFFVNRNGWRARPDWIINWEGRPTAFALSHPYLLAFEANFIEIRHLETAALVYIITAKSVRMLHVSTSEVSRFRGFDLGQHHADGSRRFFMRTRTRWVKMLSPVWISGRGNQDHSICHISVPVRSPMSTSVSQPAFSSSCAHLPHKFFSSLLPPV